MSLSNTFIGRIVLAVILVLSIPTAMAAVPDGINYQAYLTDSAGAPVDVHVSITFAAYNVDVGGVPLWSQTGLISPENGLLSVRVQDFGPGISERDRERVFAPFHRLSHKLSDGVTGTGIGLKIARDLARSHEGTLCLVDCEKGACFDLRMDVSKPEISG